MKLKTILTALLFALCCMGATAQTTYPDAIKRFLTVSGKTVSNDIQEGLTMITQAFAEEEGEKLPEGCTPEELANEYMETQFFRDMVTLVVPYFAEELSIEDINRLADIYETEEGSTAYAHSKEFLSDNRNLLIAAFTLMGAAEDIKAGKKPKNVKTTASKQRKKLFMEYCELREVQSTLEELKSSGESMLYEAAADTVVIDDEESLDYEEYESPAVTDVDQKMLKAYHKYVDKNLMNICLNAADCMTDEDLRFMITLSVMPEFKKMQNAVEGILYDPESFAMEILGKYAEWLEGHE